MHLHSETKPAGSKSRSAAERVRSDRRRIDTLAHQLAARPRPAPSGSGVVQRAIKINPNHWYTDVDDVLAAASKAGVDLTPVRAVIARWVTDGTTHAYADWRLFLAGAMRELPAAGAAAADEGKRDGGGAPAPSLSRRGSAADFSGHDDAGSAGSGSDDESGLWDLDESAHSDRAGGGAAAAAPARPYGAGAPGYSGDYEAEQARLQARLERHASAAAAGPAGKSALKLRKSTINFSRAALEAGAVLGVGAQDIESRKPHTKTTTGGGGGGTDHQGADGKAAVRGAKVIKEKIKKRSGGANVKPKDFLRGLESAGAAAAARSAKDEDRTRKELEAIASTAEDRLDWLAYLAPAAWRELQKARDNDVRAAPSKKQRIKALQAMAEASGWPLVWDEKYGRELYSR